LDNFANDRRKELKMGFSFSRTGLTLLVMSILLATPAFVAARPPVTPNPVPFLNPIAPAAIAPGGPAFSLIVTGTGFVPGSVVKWKGSPRTTTFVSSSQLTAAISAADIATPGTAAITVVSPAPGGGTSNQQFFQVALAVPALYWSSRDVTGKVPLTSLVAGGDFNNDGKYDVAVALGGVVYVLLSNGDGTFQ
jgi:hypothetical protein